MVLVQPRVIGAEGFLRRVASVMTFAYGRDVFTVSARRRCGWFLVMWCRNVL
jgi:hypothetical protein